MWVTSQIQSHLKKNKHPDQKPVCGFRFSSSWCFLKGWFRLKSLLGWLMSYLDATGKQAVVGQKCLHMVHTNPFQLWSRVEREGAVTIPLEVSPQQRQEVLLTVHICPQKREPRFNSFPTPHNLSPELHLDSSWRNWNLHLPRSYLSTSHQAKLHGVVVPMEELWWSAAAGTKLPGPE